MTFGLIGYSVLQDFPAVALIVQKAFVILNPQLPTSAANILLEVF